jgi:predicted ATP-dependent serine protease
VGRGEDFLGQKTERGEVLYLGLEDNLDIVADHLRRLGTTDADNIHVIDGGEGMTIDVLDRRMTERPVALVVVDPLFGLVHVNDASDYAKVMNALAPLRALSKKHNTHICIVHHMNKKVSEDAFDGILGSTSIFGSVDTAILLRLRGNDRTITTRQRFGSNLEETLIRFDEGRGFSDLDVPVLALEKEKEKSKESAIENSLLDYVSHFPDSTEEDIKDKVKGKWSVVSRVLHSMVGGVLTRQGAGKKGDPFRYSETENPFLNSAEQMPKAA